VVKPGSYHCSAIHSANQFPGAFIAAVATDAAEGGTVAHCS